MDQEVTRALLKLKEHPDLKDDPEQVGIIADMERKLDELRVSREFANSEPVKKQVEAFLKKIDDINVRLMTERKMTEQERTKLFHDKDMLVFYIKMNSAEEIEQRQEALKEEIIREAADA